MRLTTTGEYAIRAVLHLASQPLGSTVPIADVASAQEIPENYLRKIVGLLTRSGLCASVRGVAGGIRLSKSAEMITLLDVVEAAEGKISLNACLLGPNMCHRTPWCAVHIVWCEAQQKIREILQKKTIAELAANSIEGCAQARAAEVQESTESPSMS